MALILREGKTRIWQFLERFKPDNNKKVVDHLFSFEVRYSTSRFEVILSISMSFRPAVVGKTAIPALLALGSQRRETSGVEDHP